MPSILFSHQNFPAQFGAFGAYLAKRGWDVTFAAATVNGQVPEGCRMLRMKPHREPSDKTHRYARALDKAMINGQGFANAAISAAQQGLKPDIVVAHSGWGSGTFAKSVWPDCRFVAYTEWFYRWPPIDQTEKPDQSRAEDGRAFALARNAPMLLDIAIADHVWCPTAFQAAQFPARIRPMLDVLHDGVNTDVIRPDADVSRQFGDVVLPQDARVITYATRGMERHRGFPQFIEALGVLQQRHPDLHALIAGEDRVAYGRQLPNGQSWKQTMLDKVALDRSRVHFTGLLSRKDFTRLLQVSDVHVYLTVPFVLSWSLIEAMSAGCSIVGSDVEPVREVLENGTTATLIDHDDHPALVGAVEAMLEDRAQAAKRGEAARDLVEAKYSRRHIWPVREKRLLSIINK